MLRNIRYGSRAPKFPVTHNTTWQGKEHGRAIPLAGHSGGLSAADRSAGVNGTKRRQMGYGVRIHRHNSETRNLPYLDLRRTDCSQLGLERGRNASRSQKWRPIMSVKLESRDRPTQQHAVTTSDAIRQFHVNVPETELTELRRRINATKWPERETVTDASQGVQLATMQALARYWAT